MKAGLMRDVLVFESPVEETTASGFVRREWRESFRCRAWRRKMQAAQSEEQAHELFTGQTAVFQVRRYPQVAYGCRVRWGGCYWEIRLIEPDKGELTLTLKKIDV